MSELLESVTPPDGQSSFSGIPEAHFVEDVDAHMAGEDNCEDKLKVNKSTRRKEERKKLPEQLGTNPNSSTTNRMMILFIPDKKCHHYRRHGVGPVRSPLFTAF